MQEAWVPSLGQEDPLEKEMATHSNICAWVIPRTEEAGYSPWGRGVGHNWVTKQVILLGIALLFSVAVESVCIPTTIMTAIILQASPHSLTHF